VTTPRSPLPLIAAVAAALVGGALAWWLVADDPCGGRSLAALEGRAARTPVEERCLGHALRAAGRPQAAVDAYLRALDGGERDDAMLAFALAQAAATPDARALVLLARWPDDSVEALLVEALDRKWPLSANALDVLERRGRATDDHRRRLAERDRAVQATGEARR
jgi:hypothetical protein